MSPKSASETWQKSLFFRRFRMRLCGKKVPLAVVHHVSATIQHCIAYLPGSLSVAKDNLPCQFAECNFHFSGS